MMICQFKREYEMLIIISSVLQVDRSCFKENDIVLWPVLYECFVVKPV